mmetsp:Transcript_62323/g.147711  ORF Transcript_62323/g.147711 Transcript_62323/m.147711 type:complete len:188 (+) Transcript_62323:488-1051(+)
MWSPPPRSDQMEPRAMRGLQHVRIVSVACGETHSLALTENCLVYAWGRGAAGRLGLSTSVSRATPHLVETLAKIRMTGIAAGFHHSGAVSEEGALFTWGAGSHGQLGHGESVDCHIPTHVEVLTPFPLPQSTLPIRRRVSAESRSPVSPSGPCIPSLSPPLEKCLRGVTGRTGSLVSETLKTLQLRN